MVEPEFQDYDHDITLLDTGFQRPNFDACYLIRDAGQAAFIDTGAYDTAPRALRLLALKGMTPQAVAYVILTHVHLDHAGGAGRMMQCFPNAKLVVHPRGARHMIDPTRLRAGAVGVYGEAAFKRDYGTLIPVPAQRVIEAPDGHELVLGSRPLRFLDTPGHANHHVCIWDARSRGLFTGDTLGMAYRELAVAGRPFALVSSTPVQFDPEALYNSLDRLWSYRPERAFLTHFGEVRALASLFTGLRASIAMHVRIAEQQAGGTDRYRRIYAALSAQLEADLRAHGCTLTSRQIAEFLHLDLDLNTQGLEVWLDRRAA